MSATLLIIEDDLAFCDVLRLILTRQGFQVHEANTALVGLQKAYALNPDAVILDIMLPDLDGWQICSRLKEMSDIPVIILTAFGAEEDVIKGLNLGADGYIIKPVTAQELVARVCAVLRRNTDLNGIRQPNKNPLFSRGNLKVDFERHEVTINGRIITLSSTEFRLLSLLIQHQGRGLSHDFLLREVWGAEYTGQVEYLHQYISYLRHKIEKDPNKPILLHNEREFSYRFG